MTACNLVGWYQRFERTYEFHPQGPLLSYTPISNPLLLLTRRNMTFILIKSKLSIATSQEARPVSVTKTLMQLGLQPLFTLRTSRHLEFHNVKQDTQLLLWFKVISRQGIKSSIFQKIIPCSPLNVSRRFRVKCCLHFQGRGISRAWSQHKAVSYWFLILLIIRSCSSETSADFQRII
jgi:hypothetical protein